MPRFAYKAYAGDGRSRTGKIEAETRQRDVKMRHASIEAEINNRSV